MIKKLWKWIKKICRKAKGEVIKMANETTEMVCEVKNSLKTGEGKIIGGVIGIMISGGLILGGMAQMYLEGR